MNVKLSYENFQVKFSVSRELTFRRNFLLSMPHSSQEKLHHDSDSSHRRKRKNLIKT